MEGGGGASNGGMLYHEVQESKLCAVHCANTVLQGPFFSEFDLAALASDLDRTERQMMLGSATGDFLPHLSHNVSLDGDFSIQVLQKALEVTLDVQKVSGEWYNFDSLYAAPEHLSKFYLSAYLDSLKGFGWSIFLVRGNFPKECPMTSSEASNGYGQWLSPEDAERITKSCNSASNPGAGRMQQLSDPRVQYSDEDEDLKAAIAASLMDSTTEIKAEVGTLENENKNTNSEAS
ncbi:unnamed protein product [Fraxinus pennsylvanica]|uniref:ubiquitinyl hydrolase 1 n=1 Tax=Fraxinus pennsylvanica TaxID=56036 RepID=A0AAD1ZBL2_9LAMI|nr:unnamed protein product [Fraxinus pennsylvanica]